MDEKVFEVIPDPTNTIPPRQCVYGVKVNDDPYWENCCLERDHPGAHRTYFENNPELRREDD